MLRKIYITDLSDVEWDILEPSLCMNFLLCYSLTKRSLTSSKIFSPVAISRKGRVSYPFFYPEIP
jgi:hypothetical protein